MRGEGHPQTPGSRKRPTPTPRIRNTVKPPSGSTPVPHISERKRHDGSRRRPQATALPAGAGRPDSEAPGATPGAQTHRSGRKKPKADSKGWIDYSKAYKAEDSQREDSQAYDSHGERDSQASQSSSWKKRESPQEPVELGKGALPKIGVFHSSGLQLEGQEHQAYTVQQGKLRLQLEER